MKRARGRVSCCVVLKFEGVGIVVELSNGLNDAACWYWVGAKITISMEQNIQKRRVRHYCTEPSFVHLGETYHRGLDSGRMCVRNNEPKSGRRMREWKMGCRHHHQHN
jgi:hypothetical protein